MKAYSLDYHNCKGQVQLYFFVNETQKIISLQLIRIFQKTNLILELINKMKAPFFFLQSELCKEKYN